MIQIKNLQDIVIKNGLKTLFALTVLIFFLVILSPFLIPVTLGGILAMAFSPFISFFMRKGLSRKRAMQALTLLILLGGIIPTAIFLNRGSHVMMEMMKDPNGLLNGEVFLERSRELIGNVAESTGMPAETMFKQFEKFSENWTKFIYKMFGTFLSEIPEIALMGIITILSTYFFLGNEEKIRELYDRYFYFSELNGQKFLKMLKSSCREVFYANFLTGILQALVVSIGALIAGFGDFFLVFFVTFIFSFVPVIGAAPVAVGLAFFAFLSHNILSGTILLVVAGIAGISDNIIRPYLNSYGEVDVPPFIAFMAVIGGVVIMGLPGLFVAPLTATITFGMVPILFDEYLHHQKSDD